MPEKPFPVTLPAALFSLRLTTVLMVLAVIILILIEATVTPMARTSHAVPRPSHAHSQRQAKEKCKDVAEA